MIGELDPSIKVIRNDEMTAEQIRRLSPAKIILSPGPGRPQDAGVTVEVAQTISKQIPTLGVCLGHQAICQAFGAQIVHAKRLMHGKQSTVTLNSDCALFKGLPKQTTVARYHSLAAQNVPDCLEITARTDDGEIMAVQHKQYQIYGVQFHPESILTPLGRQMLENFINI